MNWTVRGIASPAVASGLRLAGIPTDTVTDGDTAAARLGVLAADRTLGILLVEERLLDAVPPVVRREVERRPAPIVVPVPTPAWGEPPGDAEGLILELLRRAIGYRVRLK
ncbi:MAG TPA: V-type ATP synthase subunit F [Gemmatimonadaceae bacterium]|nr:V-type ATP synthase subunit F [Gemmatimonadaceae bacterium]